MPPTFNNYGTFTKASGTGTAAYASATITNGGNFNYNSGGLAIGANFTQTAGNANLGTNFTVGSNVRVEAGSFTGRGAITGYFYNNGSVSPGNQLGLITAASFTNTAAATLNIQLGAVGAPGTNYDRVALTGGNSLNGTLNVTLLNGFVPSPGNQFTVMVHTARSGVFAFTNSSRYDFTILYTSSNVVRRAENAKPAIVFNSGLIQMVCRPFQIAATGNDVDGAVTNLQFYLNGGLLGSFTNAAQINPYTAKMKVSYDFPGLSTLAVQATDERGAVTTTNVNV